MDEAIIKAMLVNAIKIGKFVARLKKKIPQSRILQPQLSGLCMQAALFTFWPLLGVMVGLEFSLIVTPLTHLFKGCKNKIRNDYQLKKFFFVKKFSLSTLKEMYAEQYGEYAYWGRVFLLT